MVSLSTLMKLGKSGLGPEELCDILGALGMKIEGMGPVDAPRDEFTALAKSASLPGATLSKIKGRMKSGEIVHAILVSVPASKQ